MCVREKYCMVSLIIKYKSLGMHKKPCERVKNRRGTSEIHLICILDQFLYFPVAEKKKAQKTFW